MNYPDNRPLVVKILGLRRERRQAKPVDPAWLEAFNDSRARGHNTDAYTFQIAWAYAQQHFEAQEKAE